MELAKLEICNFFFFFLVELYTIVIKVGNLWKISVLSVKKKFS